MLKQYTHCDVCYALDMYVHPVMALDIKATFDFMPESAYATLCTMQGPHACSQLS